MRIFFALAWGILTCCASAQFTTGTSVKSTTSTSARPRTSTSVRTTVVPTTTGSPCSKISSIIHSYTSAYPSATNVVSFAPSLALACLESVPLHADRSSAFVDYLRPFLEFQSTLAYLKNPPTGYTLPGVDIFKGLDEIQSKIRSRAYLNQWAFEKDLYYLINTAPHDFHLNLPLPLVNFFIFRNYVSLVSISPDGTSLPQVYFKRDLTLSHNTSLSWRPSPVVSIDGQPVAEYLEFIAETTSDYQDPDAIYNLLFGSIPGDQQENIGSFDFGSHTFGMRDTTTYTFANGTSTTRVNVAFTKKDFTGVKSGDDIFSNFEIPKSSSVATPTPTPNAHTTVTHVPGYPTPVVLHSDGYTGGYFLPNSDIAVLVMTAFAPSDDSLSGNAEQQIVIQKFLALCKTAGKQKLIIDLSVNGGGSIFNGYDAFKQIFPTLVPFGASRYRSTPALNYLGEVFSGAGVYTADENTPFQIQAELDANLHRFPSWDVLDGPYLIYGDNFTAELRYNLSDPTQQVGNGIIVSGYGVRSNLSAQVFSPENIVMLQDGACGSTCSIFAEFMKSQGGVRSIAVGGRPQNGPMQGIAGSKGAQVLTYGVIQLFESFIPAALKIFNTTNQTPPPLPPQQYIPSLNNPPLGQSIAKGARFNLRNNYRDDDTTNTPLQFIYEAANCRLFFTVDDLFDYSALWARVANVAWGNGTCVPGSTVNANNLISQGAFDTVPFSKAVFSSVKFPATPGSLQATNTTIIFNGTTIANVTVPDGNGTGAAPSSTPTTTRPVFFSSAGELKPSMLGLVGALAGLVICL